MKGTFPSQANCREAASCCWGVVSIDLLCRMLFLLAHLFVGMFHWLTVVVPSFMWRVRAALEALRTRPLYSATRTDGPSPKRIPYSAA